jgi:hypothetical protein
MRENVQKITQMRGKVFGQFPVGSWSLSLSLVASFMACILASHSLPCCAAGMRFRAFLKQYNRIMSFTLQLNNYASRKSFSQNNQVEVQQNRILQLNKMTFKPILPLAQKFQYHMNYPNVVV